MGNPWKRKQEFKLGNVNEKDWGCKNPFPIISIEHAAWLTKSSIVENDLGSGHIDLRGSQGRRLGSR